MFTQMSEKQVIEKFKEQVMAAIVKEYKQLHDMTMFVRVCTDDLTTKQKRDALRAITLIK